MKYFKLCHNRGKKALAVIWYLITVLDTKNGYFTGIICINIFIRKI